MPSSNEVIRQACELAVEYFGGGDGVFNGAGFSAALKKILDLDSGFDGEVVFDILSKRADIVVLCGRAHYMLLPCGVRRELEECR